MQFNMLKNGQKEEQGRD